MNINLKFGEPIYVDKLDEAYQAAIKGNAKPEFLQDFEKLLNYAHSAPKKDYHYDIGRLIMEHYNMFTCSHDQTFVEMHKILFGDISIASIRSMNKKEQQEKYQEILDKINSMKKSV